jgi:hypothetical protein
MNSVALLSLSLVLAVALPSQAPLQSAGPTAIKLSLSAGSVAGSGTVTGRILLNRSANTFIEFELSSDQPAVGKPELTRVAVSPGKSESPVFRVATTRVTENKIVQIRAVATGLAASAALQVTVRLDAINIPAVIASGTQSMVTLVLSGPPPPGAQATIQSNNPQVLRFGIGPFASAASSKQVILNGPISTLAVIAATVDSTTVVNVTAEFNGVKISKALSVAAPPGT